MSFQLSRLSLRTLGSDLALDKSNVTNVIRAAFGPDGPGIILVDGLSDQYLLDRNHILSSARALSRLSEEQLKPLELPENEFSVGWSRGRESFKGVIDTNKGSFYANPLYDDPSLGDSSLFERYPYVKPRIFAKLPY